MEDLENAALDLLLKSSLMMLSSVAEDDGAFEEVQCVKKMRLQSLAQEPEPLPPPAPVPIREKIPEPKRKKRLWIEKWREVKQTHGNLDLVCSNSLNFTSYRDRIRIDELSFNEILSYIADDIRKQDTIMRTPVPADQKLSLTLRFLATGESFNRLNYETGYSNKFLSESIMDVCNAICDRMQDRYLKFPETKQEWIQKADRFSSRWEFPHCLGALDCKHIQFIAPKKERDSLFDAKAFNSVTLLGLADADCKFTFVDIGRHGPIKDEKILEKSHLVHILRQGQQHLPSDALLGHGRLLPYVIITDEAFPLEKHCMKPYSCLLKNEKKKVFNARLSHARQCVERALGILYNRFPVLQTRIFLNHDKVKRLVLCCCILHNFLMEKNTWYRKQVLSQEEKDALALMEVSSRKKSAETTIYEETVEPIRDSFANYFINEGSSPWQHNLVELIDVAKSIR